MSSVAISLYDENQRGSCYECPETGSGLVKARGGKFNLECRMFTQIGEAVETRLTARQTDIFQTNLIDIVEVGVDTAQITFGKKFKFKAQSRGGGGLSKYQCGADYQIPELIKHEKFGYTELIYVHFKGCPKELISTELQSMVYELDNYSESYDTNNMLSDMFLLAAREAVAEQVQYTDIIGVYGSADEKANSYDGILAQAYWAYTLAAYFHSVQFTVNESIFVTGTYLHCKYSGQEIDILFDDSQASNPAIERYQSRDEVYQRAVNWLNDEIRTASDRKYVDATYNNNDLIVTSKFAETTVNFQMFVSEESAPNWASCSAYNGVTYKTLQGVMPIDERPILVKWRRYTDDNILQTLPQDIYLATRDLDNTLLENGQSWALYIDDYLWKQYRQALKTRPNDATAYNIADDFNVYTLDALSQYGGTGIWFVTVESATERLRNIAHLVDTADRTLAETIQIRLTDDCREMKMFYELLHGVMVKDFRLFASNLLCSPFVALLKEPYEKTLPNIPCWNRKVRDSFINPDKFDNDCGLQASFCKVDEYQNCALYAVPDGLGGYDVKVLEDGQTKPNGALPVYEIQFKDKSVGISASQLAGATYSYLVQTDDGLEYTLTAKDPILQYVSLSAGTTFNIIQTVTLENGCADTYDASLDFETDFPFECRGACDSVDVILEGRIDRSNVYTLTGSTFDTNINVFALGTAYAIDMTGVGAADAVAAAVVINQWFEDNNFTGTAEGVGADLSIFSPEVIFNDTVGAEDFVNPKYMTIVDSTQFDEADGIGEIEITVYCQGDVPPVNPTFTELPDYQSVDDCASGWIVAVNLETILGCSFDGLEGSASAIPDDEYFVNFEILN